MADPGFPRGGGAYSPGGPPTYDFAKNSQKLHEIERIWAPGGEGARVQNYVDPPLLSVTNMIQRLKYININIIIIIWIKRLKIQNKHYDLIGNQTDFQDAVYLQQ